MLHNGKLYIISFLGETYIIVLSAEVQYMVVFQSTIDMHKNLIMKFLHRLLISIKSPAKFLSF